MAIGSFSPRERLGIIVLLSFCLIMIIVAVIPWGKSEPKMDMEPVYSVMLEHQPADSDSTAAAEKTKASHRKKASSKKKKSRKTPKSKADKAPAKPSPRSPLDEAIPSTN